MYARVVEYHARPHITRSEAATMYHQIIAVLDGMDGFLGSTFLMNEATHRAVSITWWRDDACASSGGRKSLPLLIRISDMMVSPPVISGYDVVDQVADRLVPVSAMPNDSVPADPSGVI